MARQHPERGADDHPVAGAAAVPARTQAPSAGHTAPSAGAAPSAGTSPSARVRERLERRTREILDAPRPKPTEEDASHEKAVVHECRYLMRLLATRRRSEGEMRRRLAQREVPGAVAHEVIARIDRAGLIDDAAFARDWVQQRRALRALGDEALRRELEDRRVASDLIEEALRAGEDDEEQRCRELVRSRLDERDRARLREERDGAHRRKLSRRLDALLTRKGYPGDLAVHVISGELRAAAEEPAA
ncbi:regulatory protein RecX [Brachybacterium aquaticum]|uniref:Regulatory protein RecX n=1 Tax=Brachybacterium aquaticum TaxID=1432564 RepID=A0A841AG55_9MICO|nr:regulatory protein RecX [Brachybacterium aquaticum]MBB5832028.1 regulatory protein [Brachybacterium aquaticum]